MLGRRNKSGTKIISIFVIIAFLSSSFWTLPAQAQSGSIDNLSPQLLFKRLDDNKDIKNMAMLDYILVSNIFSREQDMMELIEQKRKITSSILEEKASFDFSMSIFDRAKGHALVPCYYGDTPYWCFAKRRATPSEETGLSYDVTFYTDEEIKENGAVNSLHLLAIADRKEQLAIRMASDSERKHDEKIRAAILSNKYLSINEKNSKSLGLVYEFLNIVSPALSFNFKELVASGQLMIITGESDEMRLEEPHAGGRGIYLPNDPKYFDTQVIVHELYAKAGFTHEEALRMEEIFAQFVNRKVDAIIDKPGKLPEWMSFTPEETKTLEFAQFVDLTSVIKTRDYSEGQESTSRGVPAKKSRPLRVLHAENEEAVAIVIKLQLERSGFDVVEYQRVSNVKAMEEALEDKEWDIVLSDYSMPGFSGREAAKLFRDKDINIPFILVTGNSDAYDIVDVFKFGVTEYVNKADIGVKLGPVVTRSLEEAKNKASRSQSMDGVGKYRLMNMLPIGVHIVDSIGVIRDINDRELELLGYTREEMIGKPIFNFIHPSQVEDAIRRFRAKLEEKLDGDKKTDRLYVKKDGTTIIGYTQDHVLRNPVGTPREVVTSFEDITERRKTEKALKESEVKFKEVFTESPIGFVVMDDEGNIFDANLSAISIMGTSNLFPLMGHNASRYFDFIETGKGPLFGEAVLDYDKLREKGADELEKRGKIFVKYSLTPVGVDNEDTKPNRYHLQLQDISKAHRREVELENAYTELEKNISQYLETARLLAIGQNTDALADGINNPANNIKSIVEDLLVRMLKGAVVEDDEVKKVLRQVAEQITRITSETETFQGFARAQTGSIPVSIQDILTGALKARKFVTKNLGVEVSLDHKEDLSVIIADKVVLTRAFADIIYNAASSMKGAETKELTISTEHRRDEDGQEWVMISISDTGQGLSKAELDDIWNPFPKETDEVKGMGARRLFIKDKINEHGGKIKLDSELGKGTTYTIEFPVIKHYKEEIKHFSTLELKNIYRNLWHDLNGDLGAIYAIKDMMGNGDDLPQDLQKAVLDVFGESEKLVELIGTARHSQDSEGLLVQIGEKIGELKGVVANILTQEVTSDLNIFFKDAISQLSDSINAAEEKIEEGRRMLEAVHTKDAKEDIYKGLWKALATLVAKSNHLLDMSISTFDEQQMSEVLKEMFEARTLAMGTGYILDKALADRGEILVRVETKLKDLMGRVKGIEEGLLKVFSDDPAEMASIAARQLGGAIQGIDATRKMLEVEHSFENPLKRVKALDVLKDAVTFFKTSKKFFRLKEGLFDEVEVLKHEVESLFIKADDPAFRYALYNVLSIGFIEEKDSERKLNPENKKIEISADRNGLTGEIIFTFKTNYYRFLEEDLEEVDLGHGEKGPAVLRWQNGESTPIAQAHKIISSFAGRITVSSDKDGSTIRMYVPYVDEIEVSSRKAAANPKREEEAKTEVVDQGLEGWPEEIVKGRANILVADDEKIMRKYTRKMLEDKYNVWVAADGVEALKIIEQMHEAGEEVHLGLFDLSMPGMGGVELIRTSRDREYKFPILVVTGHGTGDARVVQLQEDGAIEGAVGKPANMPELEARIEKLTHAAVLPKDERSLELQMNSAEKVALVYGEDTEEGIKKLRAVGFKGDVRIAKNEEELKDFLASGEQFDVIVNTTSENLKDLIKRIFASFEAVPEVVDASDMQLQEKLITICA